MISKAYNGDCMEVLESLRYNGTKVDAILTDPPNNVSRKNNFSSM